MVPTPHDDPELLPLWEAAEKELTGRRGLSQAQAFQKIAEASCTTPRAVYYWLKPKSVLTIAQQQRRRAYDEKYRREIASVPRYIREALAADVQLTLGELRREVFLRSGIRFDSYTLEKILANESGQHGNIPIRHVGRYHGSKTVFVLDKNHLFP